MRLQPVLKADQLSFMFNINLQITAVSVDVKSMFLSMKYNILLWNVAE